MEIRAIRALRGPNVWARRISIEAVVGSAASPSLQERLTALLPGLDFAEPLEASLLGPSAPAGSVADALVRVALHLQCLAGSGVSFGLTSGLSDGSFKVVVEYREEAVGRRAFAIAEAVIDAAVAGTSLDLASMIDELRRLDQNIRLGPSTGSIVRAAEARGIPYRRLNDGSLVQFGQGARSRRILAAETDRTSAIAESIAQDKELTKSLLRSVGAPVPDGRPAESPEEAWEVAEEIGVPVVVKPQYGNQGRGVAVNLSSREQVMAAWHSAREEGRSIMVERFATGDDHRLLVIGHKVVAAALRQPPRVTGDGASTIEQLVEEVNKDPRRGEDHATSLSKMKLDAIGLAVLAEQGCDAKTILAAGRTVVLRRNANLSTGGSAIDVTDRVHPDVAARVVDAVRVIGLDIAGVDVVCRDISRPLEDQGGIIVEINAAPGLRMHLEPSEGRGRPVGEAIVSTLYADGDEGRVPLVAVTGNNGKTTTTRLVAHLFKTWGKRPGMTCSDGIYVDGRRIDTGDCSGPKSARAVLMNPSVEAAVLETARGGILREGLGFDRADVAIVCNVGEGDHLGMNGIDTIEQLAHVKGTIVRNVSPSGAAVLNAADPLTLRMARECPGSVILFARDPSLPAVKAHLAKGGRCVVAVDGHVILADGARTERLADLRDVPLTKGGRIGFQVENVLAAVAAGWSVGIPSNVIRQGIATFGGDTAQAPGRFNVRTVNGATIVMDYGHNPDALIALIDAVSALPHQHRTVVMTGAGDRRDVDLVRQGEIVGDGFDRVVLFEDACNRGRQDGEVIALLKQGADRGNRVSELIVEEVKEHATIERSLERLRSGDLLVVLVDRVESSIALIDQYIATTAPNRVEVARPHADLGVDGGRKYAAAQVVAR